jgi:capsular polysaccharide biosynthesis protein
MNLEDLEKRLRKDSKATSVEIVRFETLTFAEQVTTVRQAHILIGNHGAGISNLIFMDKTAHVLEFTVDYRDFFIYLAEWKGIHHLPIPIIDENRLSEMDLTKTVSIVNNELMG